MYSVLNVVTVKLCIYLGYYNALPVFARTFFVIWHFIAIKISLDWSRPFQFRTREQDSLRCKVLFKTHIDFFTLRFGNSTFVFVTLLIPALGSPLSNRFLQVRYRITERMSGGQQSNWLLWRKHYLRDHFGSIKAASRFCVCSGKH
jgi:hypothetical protein